MEEEEEEEEEVICEDLIQEARSGDKINLDAHTLEMIKDVKKAHDDFTRRTRGRVELKDLVLEGW